MRAHKDAKSVAYTESTIWIISFCAALVSTLLFIFSGITATMALRIPSLVSGILLVPAFVIMMACIHEYSSVEKKFFSRLGLLFAIGYAVLIGFNYYMQLTLATQPAFIKTFDMKSF